MSKLERATYICLITVSLVSLVLLVENRFFGSTPPGQPGEETLVGKREANLPEALWTGSSKNVVLLLSTRCRFCAESIPLYRELSQARKQAPGGGFSLLVASFDPPSRMQNYLDQENVSVDNVFPAQGGFVGVSVTPAIFIVDSNGVVQRAFFGRLNWIQERRLRIALN